MSNIIGLWEDQYDEFGEYKALIYNETTHKWRKNIKPFVWHNNEWRPIGKAGTLMIPLITNDNKYFYTSNSEMFLVRNYAKNVYSIISCSLISPPTKTVYIAGEIFDPTGMIIQV